MNVIFCAVMLLSFIFLAISSPENLLSSLLGGAESSLKTAITLFCVYAVWMGLSKVAENAGITRAASKMITPVAKKIFKTENKTAIENVAMNVSCNLLGIGGAATPFAVKAINAFETEKNGRAQILLFIINATSIQILPTTVIALRASAGSSAAFDIFLPSLIATAISTTCAVLLFAAGGKLWRW